MRLTAQQWSYIKDYLPEEKVRDDGRGRPWKDPREVLEGVLWILKSGARWQDLPSDYPPYQTCHRRFQRWNEDGTLKKCLEGIINHLRERGGVDLNETFIDATFVVAKKGVQKLEKPRVEKALKSWQLRTLDLFQSPYPLKVLHRMRVDWLNQQSLPASLKKRLEELSETRRMILTRLTLDLPKEGSNSSLLTRIIARSVLLRMEES